MARTSIANALSLAEGMEARTIAVIEPAKVNREEWLETAIAALAPLFAAQGLTLPEVRVSCGFPKGNVKKVIGQCWATGAASDSVAQLFISPFVSDSVRVLDILVHELIHAVDNCENGHKAAFVKMAKSLGLEGKPTATVAGADLTAALEAIVERIGSYPHANLADNVNPTKKQTTRMIKVECPEDGYTLRTTAKWLQVGLPSCPCGTVMVADIPAEEDPEEGEDD